MPTTPIHKQKNWMKNNFKDRPENINRSGGKPKIYTQIKELGYSAIDLRNAFKELVFEKIETIEEYASDRSKPIIVTIVARACLNAANSGDFNRVKEIVEYVIGKPTQQIEIDANVTNGPSLMNLSEFCDKELMERIHEAYAAYKAKRLN